jgi:hypothetical protein
MGGGVYHRGYSATTDLLAKVACGAFRERAHQRFTGRRLRAPGKKRGFCQRKAGRLCLGLFVFEGFDLGFI